MMRRSEFVVTIFLGKETRLLNHVIDLCSASSSDERRAMFHLQMAVLKFDGIHYGQEAAKHPHSV